MSRALSFVVPLAVCFCLLRGPATLSAQEPASFGREAIPAELTDDLKLLEAQSNLLKTVARLVKPAVVHIESEQPDPAAGGREVDEAGSGVIVQVGDKFFVVTNRHVVDEAQLGKVKIRLLDGRIINPISKAEDPETDIAVLQISASRLTPAKLGDSDAVQVGDFALAVGSPFGLHHSVSFGIISAVGRRDLELGASDVRYQDFLQTDASINPGNSGGPLVNLHGEVIGVNTAIASRSGVHEGIGFSIPINMIRGVIEQLATKGRVSRGFLGVHLDSKYDATEAARLNMPTLSGARVSGITANSPAAASLRAGDIVLQFDGITIENDAHLVNRVGMTPVGKSISVVIYRGGVTSTVRLTLGDRSQLPVEQR